MKPIILLSGPVGAGKTTVAEKLLNLLPGPVAYIEGDKFWAFIAKGADSQNRLENFKMVMLSAVLAALPYAQKDYEVVLDFSLPPWYLPTVINIAGKREIPLHYVVLNPGLETCKARAARRSTRAITDYSLYMELYNCFNDAQQYTICDEQGSALVLAEHIWEGLNDGTFSVK